ncbi:cellulose synthase, partial [Proteus mirabilis]|uniref:cellulose synthase operon protein YhjQ/BcsQ n=1 Tax=Proteus mirabilis TaxID=584 RepID=UPI00257514B6
NVIVIDNCVNNILHFYFPEKSKVTTLGQALLAHTPIERAICDYQNGYQILPFGVVNLEDKLHLQAYATANQHLQHFFTAFTQQYPDTLIF